MPNGKWVACAYQGVRNVSFSEKFSYVLNEWSQIIFDLLLPFAKKIREFNQQCL